MKKHAKRIVSFVLTALFCLSCLSVAARWDFAGYDTTDLNAIGKIYNEVERGYYTHNSKTDPLPEESIRWIAEGYELAYPHVGYDRLYLEGNRQAITRYNNMFPQFETRFKDFMWEAAYPHTIYQRQQTLMPSFGWVWDYGNEKFGIPDSDVFVPTTRTAKVTYDFKPYGVGPYDMKGKLVSNDVLEMYDRFLGVDVRDTFKKEIFTPGKLSEKDDKGHFIVTDEELSYAVNAVYSQFITGPSFYGENPTKDVAAMYISNPEGRKTWRWNDDIVVIKPANISWTAQMYEAAEPYLYYQYLVVNGLVFDGRGDTPAIYRYTGGEATPKVEWKYQWCEKEHPHNVIEYKYLDGKLAIVNNQPVYRTTGQFGKVYFKVTDTEIQTWITDYIGQDVKIGSIPRVDITRGEFGGYVPMAGYVFDAK